LNIRSLLAISGDCFLWFKRSGNFGPKETWTDLLPKFLFRFPNKIHDSKPAISDGAILSGIERTTISNRATIERRSDDGSACSVCYQDHGWKVLA